MTLFIMVVLLRSQAEGIEGQNCLNITKPGSWEFNPSVSQHCYKRTFNDVFNGFNRRFVQYIGCREMFTKKSYGIERDISYS